VDASAAEPEDIEKATPAEEKNQASSALERRPEAAKPKQAADASPESRWGVLRRLRWYRESQRRAVEALAYDRKRDAKANAAGRLTDC
jgi:hypothetical protein